MLLNWWEIGDNQFLHLTEEALSWIEMKIQKKFGSLHKLSKKLNLRYTTLYYKFNQKPQGIKVKLLKQVLHTLEMPLDSINKGINSVGIRKSIKQINFPVELTPRFGQLLAHGFFDGYVDTSIFKYSNYNPQIRIEFVELIKRLNLGKVKVNKPENFERDINLPDSICKLLTEVFKVTTYKSKECRTPKKFLKIVEQDKMFGYFFIKGAYLDEGTISGKQIWIVRGIHNEKLAKDIVELCKLIDLRVKGPKITGKWHGINEYSVLVPEESYKKFKKILTVTKITTCNKINKAIQKIEKCIRTRKRENKYKDDIKIIINKTRQQKYITTRDIMRSCGISSDQALCRLYLLVHTKNLNVIKIKGKCLYYVKNGVLPKKLPRINDIRRARGWR
jgi:hypothetical protein